MARESGGEGAKSSGNPSEKARALPAQLFASRAPELAPREPGRGGTVAPGVSPWPGPGGSFARAEPGSVADPGYQTCGDCMRPAWLALLQATKHTLHDGSTTMHVYIINTVPYRHPCMHDMNMHRHDRRHLSVRVARIVRS